jgi:thioredoxin-related protein
MKIFYTVLIIILLFTITSCTSNDPKVQTARMLEKELQKAKQDALEEANKLLKENKDFILVSDGELCTYEEKKPKIDKVEIGVPIEERFTGKYVKDKENYASRLPIGTKIYIVTKNNTLYRYAEVSSDLDKIYKCKDFSVEQNTK